MRSGWDPNDITETSKKDHNLHLKAEDAQGQGGAANVQSEMAQGLEPKSAFPCSFLASATTLPLSHPLHKALMQPRTGRGTPLGGSAEGKILQELGQEAPARAVPGR